jgi:hypothetical protein
MKSCYFLKRLPASGGIDDFDRRIGFEPFLTELDAQARALPASDSEHVNRN